MYHKSQISVVRYLLIGILLQAATDVNKALGRSTRSNQDLFFFKAHLRSLLQHLRFFYIATYSRK